MSESDMRGFTQLRSGLQGPDMRGFPAARMFMAPDMDGFTQVDPYFADTVLLVRGHGLNGSKDIVDSSARGGPITVTGTTAISTARYQWRGSSIKGGGSGSYFTATLGASGLLRGDFTIELWTQNADANMLFYSASGGANLGSNAFQDYGGASLTLTTTEGAGDTWRHLAIVRKDGVLRSFTHGTNQDAKTYSGVVDLQTLIFGYYVPNNNLFYVGNYNDIRVTANQARYWENFVQPNAPFPGLF